MSVALTCLVQTACLGTDLGSQRSSCVRRCRLWHSYGLCSETSRLLTVALWTKNTAASCRRALNIPVTSTEQTPVRHWRIIHAYHQGVSLVTRFIRFMIFHGSNVVPYVKFVYQTFYSFRFDLSCLSFIFSLQFFQFFWRVTFLIRVVYVSLSAPLRARKERLHCTIIRHGDDTSGGYYTLYLEYLGGLIPLLKGKRASKLHPDFIIFDPQMKSIQHRIGAFK